MEGIGGCGTGRGYPPRAPQHHEGGDDRVMDKWDFGRGQRELGMLRFVDPTLAMAENGLEMLL